MIEKTNGIIMGTSKQENLPQRFRFLLIIVKCITSTRSIFFRTRKLTKLATKFNLDKLRSYLNVKPCLVIFGFCPMRFFLKIIEKRRKSLVLTFK